MRLRAPFLIIALLPTTFCLRAVSSQDVPATGTDESKALVSVNAKGRGYPRTNFEDGRELFTTGKQEAKGSSGRALASGDFDSDGIADLMTVDTGGVIQFYKGNANSIYPQNDQATTPGAMPVDAFFPASMTFSVPITPDYLEAGDFNADGNLDLIAAGNGDNSLYVLSGNGAGGLASPNAIGLGGTISALATGEIGRADGQADVAVAVGDGAKNWLLVFEHPASAFARPPERIELPQAANGIALGFLETDSFADVAVSGGNNLTVVRGRGHAYPWDLVDSADVPNSDKVSRPAAIIETRVLPFQIAAIEIGYFTERRGQSLVMLSTAGEIQTLDVRRAKARSHVNLARLAKLNVSKPDRDGAEKFSQFRIFSEPQRPITDPNELLDHPELVPGGTEDIEAYRADLEKKKQALLDAITPAARAAKDVADKEKADKAKVRAKAGFLNAISPGPAGKLVNWELNTIATDTRLTALAASPTVKKLVKVRVSDSGRDELAMIDPATSQVHLLIRENLQRSRDPKANEIVSLESASMPVAVMPMRLNMDAVTDLVVLREGSPAPTMVMSAPSATFTVTTLTDTDDGFCNASCSLREAINAANNNAGTDAITFAVFGVMNVTSSLPRVRFPVTIDGPNGPQPLIEIRGNSAPNGANGLEINAASVVVRRLAINGFRRQPDPDGGSIGGHGITIYNFEGQTQSAFAIIEGNYLGIDSTGGQDRGNEGSGLQIFDSDNNTIGGTTAAAKNVISGNGQGTIRDSPIYTPGVLIVDGRFIVLRGNYIGTTPDGGVAIGNSQGVLAVGSNNEYGGDDPGSMNVISGNRHLVTLAPDPDACYGTGLGEESAFNEVTGEWITHNNNIKGNRVGTNATGTAAIGNCRTGIYTSPRHSAIIGSISSTGRNLVSGNDEGGIYCTLSPPLEVISFRNIAVMAPLGDDDDPPPPPEGLCTIRGNDVGVNVLRNSAIPNTYNHYFLRPGLNRLNGGGGLAIDNSNTFSSIGDPAGTSATSCTGSCNLASGETTTAVDAIAFDTGIQAHGRGSVVIFNNYAGVNGTGTAAIPNGSGGIGGGTAIDTRIGAAASPISLGNLASGNRGPGIGSGSGNLVFIQANLVGTDVTGSTAIPNDSGIYFYSDSDHISIVGGSQAADGNVIAGNMGDGVFMGGAGASAATRNNKIGVNKNGQPLGNGGDGVVLTGTFDYIGDTDAGNIIANNGGNGVTVRRFGPGFQIPRGNRIKFNSIYNNGGLGIDLTADNTNPIEGDGVTENDCGDSDTGPNTLQNYPVLSAPTFNQDGTVSVETVLKSSLEKDFTIDYYSNSSVDSSNYGEGETYIGSKTVHTDALGVVSVVFTSSGPVAPGLKITATATDIDGNTSEFSCAAGLCSARTDALEGQCALGNIIVNVTTDDADLSPNNSICDSSAADGLQCSLRAAIQTAEGTGNPGFDSISFDIPGTGIHTIAPTSALPSITQRVNIDASSQPGYSNAPLIELQGSSAGANVDGLVFAVGSDGSRVKGITINRFDTAGIRFQSNDNVLEKSYIGLGSDGITDYPIPDGQAYGIVISGARNRIGGDRTEEVGNNNITGNYLLQIQITSATAIENKVIGNAIGELTNGTLFGGGTVSKGIVITEGASATTVGGNTTEERNGICSGGTAVDISEGAHHNTIVGNNIWFSGIGVRIVDSSDNRVGGLDAGNDDSEGNVFDCNEVGVIIGAEEAERGIKSNHSLAYGGREKKIDVQGGTSPSRNTKVFGNLFIVSDPERAPNDLTVGIFIANAEDTLIGLDQSGYVNGIFDQTDSGIVVGNEAVRTMIRRNFLGRGSDGIVRPNKVGVRLVGSGTLVHRNVISGNTDFGVAINRLDDIDEIPTLNTIDNNYIGTDAVGTAQIPNGNGVLVDGQQNSITNNVISGNTDIGVDIRDDQNIVTGNRIGTDDAGNTANRNGFGMLISSSNNTVKANTVSGNVVGIAIGRDENVAPTTAVENNIIQGNTIGTNRAGTSAVKNDTYGLVLFNGANGNSIGGLTSGSGNVISGNGKAGIFIQLGAVADATPPTQNRIQGNFIGTNITGTAAIANLEDGIIVDGATSTLIGGFGTDMPAARNVISGNGRHGIRLRALLTRISGNYIGTAVDGTTALGNVQNGIFIAVGTGSTKIGGLEPNAGNTIAYNGKNGILAAADAGNNNIIDPNSLFANALMGIDLGDDGHTANDPGDEDTGPNNLQNFPEFISAVLVSGGNLVIQYKVDSAPGNSNYGANGLHIELFKADDGLEGQTFVGSTNYTEANYIAGMPGIATWILPNAASLGIQAGDKIVATATDADGNTSEFTGTNVGVVTSAPTAATAIIEGQIVTSGGAPLAGVVIALSGTQNRRTITDDNGRYRFTEVEANGFYSVAPSRVNFSFTPANRSFSSLGNRTEAAFTAIEDAAQTANPLDTPEYFVRQHYLDFLGREPDEAGFNFWSNQIRECGDDAGCVERRRINVSAAYFLSIEFQQTGGLVDGLYRASYGVRPQFAQFMPDLRVVARDVVVGREGWQAKLDANKTAFVNAFVNRPAFHAVYDGMDNSLFVDTLIQHTGVSFTTAERDAFASGLATGTMTRAEVVRSIAENNRFVAAKFNEAFVMMQYFGYLGRDPDANGSAFWLNKLNEFNGNFERAEMVKAFIVSGEFRNRFPR